jgi:predicted TIM-barrel fold metal-dependent hydrolase
LEIVCRPGIPLSSLNFSDIEGVDFHSHPVGRTTISKMIDRYLYAKLVYLLPTKKYDEAWRKLRELSGDAVDQFKLNMIREYSSKFDLPAERRRLETYPYLLNVIRYIAESYGCKATLEDVDRVLSSKMNGDFVGYVREVLDRENISKVVIDAEGAKEVQGFPHDRMYLVWNMTHVLQPEWAAKRGAKNLDEYLDFIDSELKDSLSKGCVALKFATAYYRTLQIEKVDQDIAQRSFKKILRAKPRTHLFASGHPCPVYGDIETTRARNAYQDFIIRRYLIEAGKLGLPVKLHVGAFFYNSFLDLRYQSPSLLNPILHDDDCKQTKMVMLHFAHPYSREAAVMIGQFPNLYLSIDWLMGWPDTYVGLLSHLLETAPSEKIVWGSDPAASAERIGFCARLVRKHLSTVLLDFKSKYGWTEDECHVAAANVIGNNANRLLQKARRS